MVGVYKIKNIVNDKFYIGSSIDIHKRWIKHKCELHKNRHHNRHLQHAFNLYGFDSFIHVVLEVCDRSIIAEREQHYIDLLFDENCYNIYKKAYNVNGESHHMFGKTHTEEAKLKIKQARAKQTITHSEDTKAKISKGNIGKKISISHLRKMIDGRGGKCWNKGIRTGIIPQNKLSLNEDEIIKLHQSGNSIEYIRKHFTVSWDVIKRVLVENGIETRSIKEQKTIYDERRK